MVSYKIPSGAGVLVQSMDESSFMSEPTVAENSSGSHSGADVFTQVRIAGAVGRITQYIADNSVSRLEWWLHSDRAAMRFEPNWNSVFLHVSQAVGDSE